MLTLKKQAPVEASETTNYREKILSYFNQENGRSLVEKFINLLGDDFDPEDCFTKAIDYYGQLREMFEQYDLFNLEAENYATELKKTLILAVLGYWKQERKSGGEYIVHPFESAQKRIELFAEEKKIFDLILSSRRQLNCVIELLLHDVLEDIMENIGKLDNDGRRILQYGGLPIFLTSQKLQKEKELYSDLIRIFSLNLDEKVVNNLIYVYTKFSKRLLVVESKVKKLKKEDFGRIDHILRDLNTRDAETIKNVLLEKEHNLKTIGKMNKEKMIIFYNLASTLNAAGLREFAKRLLSQIFDYYYEQWDQQVSHKFNEMLKIRRDIDKKFFDKYQTQLKKNLISFYLGLDLKFEIEEVPTWKIHEIAVTEYLKKYKENKRGKKNDVLSHYFISEELLDHSKFQEIFNRIPTLRFLITVMDHVDESVSGDFETSRFDFKLSAFNIVSKIDYYAEEGPPEIQGTGYKAICFQVQPKKSSGNEKISCKLGLRRDFLRNEWGEFYYENGTREIAFRGFSNFLNRIMTEIIKDPKQINLLKEVNKHPVGVDLQQKANDFMPNESFGKATIEDVLFEISQKMRGAFLVRPYINT